MKPFLKISLCALLILTASGCVSSGRNLKSYTAESFPASSSAGLINDLAERLKVSYPPGQTSLYLAGKDAFSQSLENKLRENGFTMMPEAGGGALTVAWTVDQLEPGLWYLLVNVSDGYRFSRVYRDDGKTVTPAAGLSQGKF